MSFSDVMSHQTHEHIFLVCSFCNFLAEINMTPLWPLSTEILCPSKHDDFTHLVQNTVCLFKFPCSFLATFVWKISFAKIQQFLCHALQLHKFVCIHSKFPALHIVLHNCQMYSDDAIRRIFNQLCAIECLSFLGTFDCRVHILYLPIRCIKML